MTRSPDVSTLLGSCFVECPPRFFNPLLYPALLILPLLLVSLILLAFLLLVVALLLSLQTLLLLLQWLLLLFGMSVSLLLPLDGVVGVFASRMDDASLFVVLVDDSIRMDALVL